MNKFFTTALLCISLSFISQPALAQQQGIGIGAMLNSPTGISLKGWVNNNLAIDGAISFSLAEGTSSFYFHSDVLYHGDAVNEDLNLEQGSLQVFYGAGFRFQWFDTQNDPIIGLRTPIGLNYGIHELPAETFFELAPSIDFSPSFRFSFGGAIGFRYYLH
ncbi:MAG: hypothetical protein U5J95_04620 [Balneolaceae bacterium]|nr:hypothetical protein [Balneolaceae bacterium]